MMRSLGLSVQAAAAYLKKNPSFKGSSEWTAREGFRRPDISDWHSLFRSLEFPAIKPGAEPEPRR